ncbi:TPA: hypothetical protein EYP66_24060 [Candidatus Poribacteria bacterium]|nr:hypothetical protein [Candidatus Poribacteria bacterium]
MELQTYATAQRNYLRAALNAPQAEVNFRQPEAWSKRVKQKLEQHIIDWLELLAALEEADDANYKQARLEPDWDFETADTEIERQLWDSATLLCANY